MNIDEEQKWLMQIMKHRNSLIRQLQDLYDLFGNLPISALQTKLQCLNMETEKKLKELQDKGASKCK